MGKEKERGYRGVRGVEGLGKGKEEERWVQCWNPEVIYHKEMWGGR